MSQPKQQARPSQSGAGVETQQAQGQNIVDRVELEMGDDPPSRYLVDQGVSTRPGVAAGATQCKSPNLDGPTDEIVSAIRLCGLVIELSSLVKERPVKVLLDSARNWQLYLRCDGYYVKTEDYFGCGLPRFDVGRWVTSMDCRVCPVPNELWGIQRKNHHQSISQFVEGVHLGNALVGAREPHY